MKYRVSISLEKSSISAALVEFLNITVCSQLILGYFMLGIFFSTHFDWGQIPNPNEETTQILRFRYPVKKEKL